MTDWLLLLVGFNSTLRQGNITHHEYIQVITIFFFLLFINHILISCHFLQVGKGRDVGLNQIALFEGKVAGGNGEQVLSRDVYRLGQLFDFFRMMSFYFTTVGFYFCTMVWLSWNTWQIFPLVSCLVGLYLCRLLLTIRFICLLCIWGQIIGKITLGASYHL